MPDEGRERISKSIDAAAEFANWLRDLLHNFPERANLSPAPPATLSRIRKQIPALMAKLHALSRDLDPILMPPEVFDPADPHTIGRLIALTLLEQPRHIMGALRRFYGSGVYAIYYNGDFPAYAPIRGTDHPIYVGKADPANVNAQTVVEQGDRLSVRLGDHVKSITQAKNLDLADFECRYLVVKSAWQKTAEDYLIHRFTPVWNSEMNVCYGFGKHGDSSSTRRNARSPWDTIHPGRPWATSEGNVANTKSIERIMADIAAHFLGHPSEGPRD